MEEAQVVEKLQPIFRDVFDNPQLIVGPEDNARTVEGWDSLVHINLISAVEQDFGIRFALVELQNLKKIGDINDLILRKLNTTA